MHDAEAAARGGCWAAQGGLPLAPGGRAGCPSVDLQEELTGPTGPVLHSGFSWASPEQGT